MAPNNIQSYTFSKQDRLFFDTNIWFFIYGPQTRPGDRRQHIYSNAYRDIITQGGRIFIDALVMAEFINRMARFYFDLWCEENQVTPSFKDFRSMDAFKPIASEIDKAAQLILVDSIPIETGFSHIDIRALLRTFQEGQHDFNDLIIEEICRVNRFVLITDDSDFNSAVDIQILSSNQKLIKR